MKKVLAIDYGTERLGLAVSRAGLAEPLMVVANDDNLFNWLKEIIDEKGIELILLGLSENKMAKKTKDFAHQLSSEIKLPLKFVDETLSSSQARSRLARSPLKLKTKQGPIDHYAAAIFLQDWLDEQ